MDIASDLHLGATPIDQTYGSAPRSRTLIFRTLVIYGLILVAGLAPFALDASAGWKVAGLGLIFPGGGFVGLGGWWLLAFPVVVALALAGCALWQLMANVFAPLFVWGASLLLAVGLAAESVWPGAPVVVPLIALAFIGWFSWKTRQITRREIARRGIRNAYLPKAEQAVLERAEPAPDPGVRELTEEELAHLRYALDRGMQPVNEFNGFDVIEQFQTSAIRYQLNNLLWGLQIAQCHYTPNFHGYLSQAQRNLIDKLTVPKVWKWWRWESLLGNFSFNFDPIARDNIMFAGFSSANIALYTANTGDTRYLEEGSLTFDEGGGRQYRHSLKTMLENGRYNHGIATYGPMYPCEPKLTYSACNVWGNIQHIVGDRLLGTGYHRPLTDKLRTGHVTEMLTHDGVPHAGRVNPLGIRLPVYSCNMVSALWGWMASCFFPDLSRRVWAILREEEVSFDDQGNITVNTYAYDRVDTGNYKKSEAGLYAHMLVYAREQGDGDVARGIMDKFNRDFGRRTLNGVATYDISNREMGALIMGVIMRTGDIRKMVHEGPPACALRGPVLEGVGYPDVLVAKAFSGGDDLELVLYPGNGKNRQTLTVSRLRPGAAYALKGVPGVEGITADSEGRASFDTDIAGRTAIFLTPL